MRIELNNIIVESSLKLDYFDDVVTYLNNNESDILNFFGISSISEKYTIKIVNYDEFKLYLLGKYGIVQKYVRGDFDSKSKTIYVLDILDQRKYTTHIDACIDDTLKMILHEFVHLCNNEVNTDYVDTIWFREGLATNLSKQNYSSCDFLECDFNLLKKDFNKYGKNNYLYAHNIVKYILNNYSDEEIKRFIMDSYYLRDKCDIIFNIVKK